MRMKRTFVSTLTGLGLAVGGVALAQQTDQPALQDQQTQQHLQQNRQADSMHKDQMHKNMAHRGLKLNKADQIIGREVVNPQGEQLGHIRELAVDGNSGRVAYAVLEFDRLADLRDRLFAVPFTALKVQGHEGMNANRDQAARDRMEAGKTDDTWFLQNDSSVNKPLVLNVSKDKLNSAQGFDRDHWPDMANQQWGKDIHAFYGEKPYWERRDRSNQGGNQGQTMRQNDRDVDLDADVDVNKQGVTAQADLDREREGTAGRTAQAGQQGQRMILKADEQLLGQDITNNNGDDIGELNNLLIDRRTGKIALVMVKLDNVEGDKHMAAVPWNQINWKWNEQEKEGTIALKSDMNQLKSHLFAEDAWPSLDRQYVTNIYRQFNERPFWETDRTGEDVLGFQE